MSEKEFKVKFRGIRGSYPVISPKAMKYGGNTACVEVKVNGFSIIIDAGTGIIEFGNELMRSFITSGTDDENRSSIQTLILLSHFHYDHIQGLSFFKPIFLKTSRIHVFGPQSLGKDVKEILSQAMLAPYAPVALNEFSANLHINNINETDAILIHKDFQEPKIVNSNDFNKNDYPDNTIVIKCLKSYAHPKDGVMIYRIEFDGQSVVYATDKESYIGGDCKLVNFARNADILIHDAQYSKDDYLAPINYKQGFGHSTPEMAIEVAKLANVNKLIFYHPDPSYSDKTIEKLEESAQKQFLNSLYAYEGLEIDLKCLK